jgi:rhodanese-related sulfurtransferase
MDKLIKKWLLLCLSVALLAGCTTEISEDTEEGMYMNITAAQAKEIMDTAENYIILDVRSQEEYDTGHIPGAILIPHTQVQAQAQLVLTDKDQLILVYCRSGRRSKLAAETLVELGYTNIKEFGGILDWPYEVE